MATIGLLDPAAPVNCGGAEVAGEGVLTGDEAGGAGGAALDAGGGGGAALDGGGGGGATLVGLGGTGVCEGTTGLEDGGGGGGGEGVWDGTTGFEEGGGGGGG